MIYCLKNTEAAAKLSAICQEFKDELVVDVKCGHYVVDGASFLGVASLIGHAVDVEPFGTNRDAILRFYNEVEKCC